VAGRLILRCAQNDTGEGALFPRTWVAGLHYIDLRKLSYSFLFAAESLILAAVISPASWRFPLLR
jgi:hypothetical protein